jgi:hypothetical protein
MLATQSAFTKIPRTILQPNEALRRDVPVVRRDTLRTEPTEAQHPRGHLLALLSHYFLP